MCVRGLVAMAYLTEMFLVVGPAICGTIPQHKRGDDDCSAAENVWNVLWRWRVFPVWCGPGEDKVCDLGV